MAPSIRGRTDGNGAVDEERRRRKPSTARTQLHRVDEEGFYASVDVALNGGLSSPLSDFASDDEIENHSRQGERRRASAVSFSSRKTTGRTTRMPERDPASPRRSSLRPPLQSMPPGGLSSRRSSRFGSPEYVAATLDENKQKKVVALFYWRRKTLETYLSAWKWVTFDAWRLDQQDQHQQRELELLRPYAPASVRPVERRPLHQSTLLRNAHGHQQLEASVGTVKIGVSPEPPRDRIRSLREEYRQLKAVERQDAESVEAEKTEKDATTFKERLRIYYRCFEAWRSFLEATRATAKEKTNRAVKWHDQRVSRRHFRVWSKPFMLLKKSETRQWERAKTCGDVLVVKRRFRMWRQWLAWTHSVKAFQATVDTRRNIKAVKTWRAWVARTVRLRRVERKLRDRLKRRSFQPWEALRTQRREKQRRLREAEGFRDHHVRIRAWNAWKHCVFHSDEAKRTDKLVAEVTCKLAVGKWKRFISRRRADHERAIKADSCLYELLLRRCWVRWCGYLARKRVKLVELERASRHKCAQDKRRAIRMWITLRCDAYYERDQAIGATSFYEQRLVLSILRRWRAYSSDLRLAREWRVQRVKRRFVLCFVAWRQHSQRSARIHMQRNTLGISVRRRLLAESLCEWRYQRRLRVAFTTVVDKRQFTTMQLYVQAWCQVSAQQQQWQRAIERIRRVQTLRLKRRLLVAWFSVVVRARCQCKLIRLFQRKHNRKKLQRCVRAFHVHANLQQLQARTQQRTIESVWHAWVVYVSDQQRKTEAMIAATQFYSSRHYARALGVWSRNVRTDMIERRNSNKALSFLITRMMRTTLQAWCVTTQARRRHRELVNTQLTRHVERLVRQCLRLWCVVARRKAKKRKVNQLLCRHLIHRLEERHFKQWCQFTRRRQAARRRVVETQQQLERRQGRRVLQAWRIVAFRLRQKRRATQLVASHNRKRVLQRVLRAWRVAAAESKHYCSNQSKAVAFHREYLLLWAFFGWQHASLASQVMKEKTRRAVGVITQHRLRRAVSTWRITQNLKHSQQLLAGRAVHFYRQRRQSKAVEQWRSFAEARTMNRRKNQKAEAFANTKIIRRCLRSWVQFTSGTRAFKLKLRVVFQTGDQDIQRKVFRRWRRYKRGSTLRLRADAWQTRTRQASIWRHWRAQVAFSHKMKANVLVTSRLLQSNTLRATFVQWTQYVARRHGQSEALKRGEAFHVRRCLQQAIWCFRVHLRHARAVELSETFHAKHALRQSWVQWRNDVKHQQRWRKLKALAMTTHRMKTSRRVFHLWRGLVEAKQRVLYLKADLFCNNLALKHVWTAWRRLVRCRSLVETATRSREQRTKGGAFTQWREFMQEQQLIRRHVNAAVAHLDRVTTQKIWERWFVFLEQCREVRRLKAQAQAFYSTRILLTSTLHAWERFVEIRHKKHAQLVEAEALYALNTTRKCFGQLEAYAAYRHRRAETIERRDKDVKEAQQRRAVAKWHTKARVLHKMRESLTHATSFCKERRLSEAIVSLVTNQTSRKQRRQDHQRAVASRRVCLTKTAFGRWKAFLVWRLRNKHLLRLFRTNQLGDYFALWLKYVKRSQRKRELQAKATGGHRQLLQHNAFARWRGRCVDWQNKRRAISWYGSRQTSQVFAVWSHRVRILRKMRLMFRFQDGFRKESHFASWKRRWWYKRQQVVRVQDASKWFVRHRLTKCFALWIQWLESKHQEKHTLRMAVGFQRRFFSRKYLQAWHGVILWHRRKRELLQEARQHFVSSEYRRVWKQFQAYRFSKKRLRTTMLEATETLEVLRAQRAVDRWKGRMHQRRVYQRLKQQAKEHCDKKTVCRSWRMLQRWFGVRQARKALAKRAEAHFDVCVSRRLLLAWSEYAQRMRRLRHGLTRFKTHYFRSVADECFYEWKAIVHLKRELLQLKHRVLQSHQAQVLSAWSRFTKRDRELRLIATQIQQHVRLKLLQKCISHWEIVAADRWMYSNLVQISLKTRERRMKKLVVERWKKLLSQRFARKQWRYKARKRRAESLRRMLQRWRAVVCGSDEEQDSEGEAI